MLRKMRDIFNRTPEVEISPVVYRADENLEYETLQSYGVEDNMPGVMVRAAELVDESIFVVSMKRIRSKYRKGSHSWLIGYKKDLSETPCKTILGGKAVCSVLDVIAEGELKAPVRVTLRERKGGKGRYYLLE